MKANGDVHNSLGHRFDNKQFEQFIARQVHEHIQQFIIYQQFKGLYRDVLFHFENIRNDIWEITQI